MPFFTFYKPGAQVFGAPREFFENRDNVFDSFVVSIQPWPNEPPWRIGRNPSDLPGNFHMANHLQKVGDLVVMDNHDEESRRPPLRNPIVTQDGRISVLLLLKGEFKEHFSDWMRSWAAVHGYETAPARSIDTKQAVKSLGDPFGVSQGPFFDGA